MEDIIKILTETRNKFNNIVTDIVTEGTYQDLLSLQNSKNCNSYNIFLEDELMKKFKKVQIKNLNSGVYISHRKFTPCSTEDCPEIREPLYGAEGRMKSKAQICNTISIFYIRILALVSAILMAINPDNNMALRRLKALYSPIGDDSPGKGKITICNPDKELYPEDFLSIEGMQELVNLYRTYNIEGEERNNLRIKQEINLLQSKIQEYFRGKYASNNTKNVKGERIINKLIKNKMQEPQSNNANNMNINSNISSNNNQNKSNSNQNKSNSNQNKSNNNQNKINNNQNKSNNNQNKSNNNQNKINNNQNKINNNQIQGNNNQNQGNNNQNQGNNRNRMNGQVQTEGRMVNNNLRQNIKAIKNISDRNFRQIEEIKEIQRGIKDNIENIGVKLGEIMTKKNNKNNNRNLNKGNEVVEIEQKYKKKRKRTKRRKPVIEGKEVEGNNNNIEGENKKVRQSNINNTETNNNILSDNNNQGGNNGNQEGNNGNQEGNNGNQEGNNGNQEGNNGNKVGNNGNQEGNNGNKVGNNGNQEGNNGNQEGNNNTSQKKSNPDASKFSSNSNVSSSNNILKNTKGGFRKRTRKLKGGSFFKKLFTKKEKPPMEQDNEMSNNLSQNNNTEPKEQKTIDDFRNLVERNEIPQEYLGNNQAIEITDIPTDLSKNKYCANDILPRELDYSTSGPYGKYFENYNKMKAFYKDYNDKLMGILLGEILSFENNQYKIRQITSDKLYEIEKKSRETLLSYYTGCQKTFIEAFTGLVDGLESSLAEQKKREIQSELGKL